MWQVEHFTFNSSRYQIPYNVFRIFCSKKFVHSHAVFLPSSSIARIILGICDSQLLNDWQSPCSAFLLRTYFQWIALDARRSIKMEFVVSLRRTQVHFGTKFYFFRYASCRALTCCVSALGANWRDLVLFMWTRWTCVCVCFAMLTVARIWVVFILRKLKFIPELLFFFSLVDFLLDASVSLSN